MSNLTPAVWRSSAGRGPKQREGCERGLLVSPGAAAETAAHDDDDDVMSMLAAVLCHCCCGFSQLCASRQVSKARQGWGRGEGGGQGSSSDIIKQWRRGGFVLFSGGIS